MSENQVREKQSRFISLRLKLMLVFTLLFALVFAGAFYWFYTFATNRAMERIEEDLLLTLEGAADGIDGDDLVALYKEGQDRYGDDVAMCGLAPEDGGISCDEGLEDNARYSALVDWFRTVQEIEPRAWPYVFVKSDDPEATYEVVAVGDMWAMTGNEADADRAFPFLYHYTPDYKPEVILWGLERTTPFMEPYDDPWGRWVSGYTPVHNSAGEAVAGIGVDFEAAYVADVQRSIQNTILPAFGAGVIILLVLVYLISNSLSRPLIALTAVAERVAEGDYDQDISGLHSGRLRDEVSTLAQVFEMMVDKVGAREQRLKRQVAELRIEIDQAKRERHVSEITETDYFRELQEKARKLRGGGGSTDE
jgi:HAMP domain-containing protein